MSKDVERREFWLGYNQGRQAEIKRIIKLIDEELLHSDDFSWYEGHDHALNKIISKIKEER